MVGLDFEVPSSKTWCTHCPHTEPLQCSADDMWEAVKDADALLPTIGPDYFTKSFFLQGYGEPGTIRILQLGPGIALDFN